MRRYRAGTTATPTPMLPGTPRPAFGGVSLRPGFAPLRQAVHDWRGFMVETPPAPQTDFLAMVETGYLAREYGECADLIAPNGHEPAEQPEEDFEEGDATWHHLMNTAEPPSETEQDQADETAAALEKETEP